MKTPSSSLIALTLVVAPLIALPACVAPSAKQAYSHPVRNVVRGGNIAISPGTLWWEVRELLGEPRRQLSEDIWLYRNFEGIDQTPEDDCGTLVITFTDGRVSDLRLVNDRAESILAARAEAKANAKLQVAKP